MSKFYQMTKWLPTEIPGYLPGEAKKTGFSLVKVDGDVSPWIEHFKSLGYVEGQDFVVRKRKDGKVAVFKRGKSPFCQYEKPVKRV